MSEESWFRRLDPQPPRTLGVTDSERYLQNLCDKSFLSPWSYSGIYRDQGKPTPGGHGKELCDLLVLFDNHLVIFSDKSCAYPRTGNHELDWSRWFRKAVVASAQQVWGAERWIRSHPERIYIDRACSRPFPIALPPVGLIKFHRVVVARNVADRCRETHGGSGSLMLSPIKHADANTHDTPFIIGQIDKEKGYIHVLDDTSLEILLRTRDTVTDFLEYLEKKEAFIAEEKLIVATGEEDLLAYYMGHIDSKGEHGFFLPPGRTHLAVREGLWNEFSRSPDRASQTNADKVSYLWDHLIEKFASHFMAGTSALCSSPTFNSLERILRFFARESRYSRRQLSLALVEACTMGQNSDRFLRVVPPIKSGSPYYVFLTLKSSLCPPEPGDDTEEQYRRFRATYFSCVCKVVKLMFPDATDIVGFAMEPLGDPGSLRSEDAIHFDAREWTDERNSEARELQQKLGILTNATLVHKRHHEFPLVAPQRIRSSKRGRKQSLRNSPCHCGSQLKFKNCCKREH